MSMCLGGSSPVGLPRRNRLTPCPIQGAGRSRWARLPAMRQVRTSLAERQLQSSPQGGSAVLVQRVFQAVFRRARSAPSRSGRFRSTRAASGKPAHRCRAHESRMHRLRREGSRDPRVRPHRIEASERGGHGARRRQPASGSGGDLPLRGGLRQLPPLAEPRSDGEHVADGPEAIRVTPSLSVSQRRNMLYLQAFLETSDCVDCGLGDIRCSSSITSSGRRST